MKKHLVFMLMYGLLLSCNIFAYKQADLQKVKALSEKVKIGPKIKRIERNLSNTDLSGANLNNTDLCYANLYKANLSKTKLHGANLHDTNLSKANLHKAILRKADLRGANLRKANLRFADLRGADLRGADLRGANLLFANLRKANLSKAIFNITTKFGTLLSHAKLRGADFENARGMNVIQKTKARARGAKNVPR
ncbi:pentapeptide repeat-containing protein [Candidatus Babeliales bacterium]|nr:pentapeptide repeat-containing protein [Candidatus Babeliales bacterium]